MHVLILLYLALEGSLWIFLGTSNPIPTSKTLQTVPCTHKNSFIPLVPIPHMVVVPGAYKQVQVNHVSSHYR